MDVRGNCRGGYFQSFAGLLSCLAVGLAGHEQISGQSLSGREFRDIRHTRKVPTGSVPVCRAPTGMPGEGENRLGWGVAQTSWENRGSVVIHAHVGRQIIAPDRHRFGAMHGPKQEMHGDRQGQHESHRHDEELGPTGPET